MDWHITSQLSWFASNNKCVNNEQLFFWLLQFSDFLQSYNKLSEICFMDCVNDFSSRNIKTQEVSPRARLIVIDFYNWVVFLHRTHVHWIAWRNIWKWTRGFHNVSRNSKWLPMRMQWQWYRKLVDKHNFNFRIKRYDENRLYMLWNIVLKKKKTK